MKASELRIGNYLQDRQGRLCQVEAITNNMDDVYAQGFRAPAIKGAVTAIPNSTIPLTEDLLVRCGGKQGDNNIYNSMFYCFEFKDLTIFISTGGTVEITKNKYSEQSVKLSIKVFFLHDFQNLIHALTGEELIINL